MKTQISTLLSELYELDPELKKREFELTNILAEMLKQKPDTHFDENFRKELRLKLDSEMNRLKQHSRHGFDWRSILAGFLAGSAVISFSWYFVLPSFLPFSVQTTSNDASLSKSSNAQVGESIGEITANPIDFGFKVEKKASAAFGTLSLVSSPSAKTARIQGGGPIFPTPANMIPADTSISEPNPTTATITNMTPPSSSVANTPAALGKVSMDSSTAMLPYQPKIYSYEYAGSGYVFKNDRMGVLKKKKNTISLREAEPFLQNFKISSLDLTKFSNLKLNNLMISEEQEYGLSLNIDFNEGNLTLSRNWSLWPQSVCATGNCQTIQIDQVPSDESALRIARDFLSKYQIGTTSYGKPFVNHDWKVAYTLASDKRYAYIPEVISVIYPLVLDGKTVYEEYGQTKGMTVNIDIKSGRVSDVYGMEKLDFEASEYEIQTDFSKILEVAKQGGRYGYGMQYPENANMVQVKVPLGEPEIIYVHLYDYQSGRSNEYLVPALKFPVLRDPKEGEYFQNTVIVPIIKEFMEVKSLPTLHQSEAVQR